FDTLRCHENAFSSSCCLLLACHHRLLPSSELRFLNEAGTPPAHLLLADWTDYVLLFFNERRTLPSASLRLDRLCLLFFKYFDTLRCYENAFFFCCLSASRHLVFAIVVFAIIGVKTSNERELCLLLLYMCCLSHNRERGPLFPDWTV
ncbi:hypothetical protein CEXT_743701, partial [Caerostris extrusa]